jgi:hypothetical protein
MLKVGDFLKYLIASQVDSPFRRALFQYFQQTQNEEELLSAEAINYFIRQLLHYPHWQQQRPQIAAELKEWLQSLWEQDLLSFTSSDLQWPTELQILEVENTAEWIEALQKHVKKIAETGVSTRLLQDSEGTALGLILRENGELEIHQWNRQMTLRRGVIEPLRQDLVLFYNSELELSRWRRQQWEIAPYSIASFQVEDLGLAGAVFRGHSFQLQQSFVETNLSQIPHLFWALKRTEQHFVSRESDPFYQGLLAALEAAGLSVRIGEAGSTEKAVDAMAQAQNALESVFVGDKLLSLLIRDLQHTLELHEPDARSRSEAIQRVSAGRARGSSSSQKGKEPAPMPRRTRQSELEP